MGVGERISLATFKIVLLCYIFCCLSWWFWYISTQKVHVDFILRRFSPVGLFTLYLRYLCVCVCVCVSSLIIIKRRIWWLIGSSFWIIPYILSLIVHKTKTVGMGLTILLGWKCNFQNGFNVDSVKAKTGCVPNKHSILFIFLIL